MWQSSCRSTWAIAVVVCFAGAAITADDTTLPLVAPVRTLGLPAAAPPDAMSVPVASAATPAEATLPGTRLPQYQLGHDNRRIPTEAELSDPTLRLILALPERPVLIEATVTLDGQPFRMVRDQRVREALELAKLPRPEPPAPDSTEPDTTDTEGTATDENASEDDAENEDDSAAREEPTETAETPADGTDTADIDSAGVTDDAAPDTGDTSGNTDDETPDTVESAKGDGETADAPETVEDASVQEDAPEGDTDTNKDEDKTDDTKTDDTKTDDTKTDDTETDDTETDDTETDEDEAPQVSLPTVPAYTLTTDVVERLRRHIEATGRTPTLQEARWIVTNWVDGPELLMLNDGFQSFRANQRPVFLVLDQDRDGTISAEEITRAGDSLRECDLDRNGIVDYEEIGRVAADPRYQTGTASPSRAILMRIPDATSAAHTYRQLVRQYRSADDASSPTVPRFDRNGNGRFDTEELAAFLESEPDLRIAIAFDSGNPDQSSLQLTSVSPELADVATSGHATETSLVLTVDGTPLEISAVQAATPDQVSFGAVVDGYPLLSRIDPTPDGRLTIRDLRRLAEFLHDCDANGDGMIAADEARSMTRLCIGRGPVVDNVLSSLRSARTEAPATVVAGPEWFVRMDRNRDGDVTRSEFPGNDEQFATLDADGDELVSAAEAVAFESRSETSADQ